MTAFEHDGKKANPIMQDARLYLDNDFSGHLSIRPKAPWNAVVVADMHFFMVDMAKIYPLKPEQVKRLEEMGSRYATRPFMISFVAFDSSGRLRKRSIMESGLVVPPKKGRRSRRKSHGRRFTVAGAGSGKSAEGGSASRAAENQQGAGSDTKGGSLG